MTSYRSCPEGKLGSAWPIWRNLGGRDGGKDSCWSPLGLEQGQDGPGVVRRSGECDCRCFGMLLTFIK